MDKIIIFGAGEEGKSIFGLLKFMKLDNMVSAFCDNKVANDSEEIVICGKPVHSFAYFKGKKCTFVIGVKNEEFKAEIAKQLSSSGERFFNDIRECLIENVMDAVEYDRLQCAYYHEDSMDHYYDLAERSDMLDVFWGKNTVFNKLFRQLDLEEVIELACGRGRHVQKYVDYANHVTLVDILEKNIDYCKERYKSCNKISYYKNNGYNLEALPSDFFTAIFSYDAMVHFEMFDIYEYLKDMHRVLKKDGMALLHHSNNKEDYKASFETAKAMHSRAFMSKELFAFLAYKAGFKIVEQVVIDWGEAKELDCVTLIQK